MTLGVLVWRITVDTYNQLPEAAVITLDHAAYFDAAMSIMIAKANESTSRITCTGRDCMLQRDPTM